MNIKKLAPWNWFKKENDANAHTIPVKHHTNKRHSAYLSDLPGIFPDEMDRCFDGFFNGFGRWPYRSRRQLFEGISCNMLKPSLDLWASEKEYFVSVEIPGVSKNDIHLELINDTLTIRGEKKQEKEEKDKSFYRLERSYGAFQRTLSLPGDTDKENIRADFKTGVLQITIPRVLLPKDQSGQIEIKYA